jgi:hypothetical protein
MLQRKQTIWLALASIISLLTIFVPYGVAKTSDVNTTAIQEIALNGKTNPILLTLSCLCALLGFICIGLFKNRSLQSKLCLLLFILCLATGAYIIYDTFIASTQHQLIVGLAGSNLYVGLLMPIIASIFVILAMAGIRADEKLIKSMDRLR